jgi:hypothetical protein
MERADGKTPMRFLVALGTISLASLPSSLTLLRAGGMNFSRPFSEADPHENPSAIPVSRPQ